MRRWILLAGLLAIVGLVAWLSLGEQRDTPRAQSVVSQQSPPPASEPESQALPQRALPEQKIDPLQARSWQPAPPKVAPDPAVMAPATPQAPPPPYAYVGKLREGRERLAVLSRQDRVFMVRAGDALEAEYRVESIGEDTVVLVYTPLGSRAVLAYTGTPSRSLAAANPAALAPEGDEVALQVSGPSQVAIGEQFTLMFGLEPAGGAIQDGNVELRYDPKVLRRQNADATESGRALITVAAGYTGHAGATPVGFRVVAAAPTTTEIRIVPANVADMEGRNLAVSGPNAYRLTVVPRAVEPSVPSVTAPAVPAPAAPAPEEEEGKQDG